MTKYMAAGAFQDLTSDRISFPNSGTWLDGLAAAGPVRRQAVRRAVLRGLARRHVPHRPVQEGGHQGARRASRSSPRPRESSAGSRVTAGLLAGLHRGHRLVRRDELRLRLRRHDRAAGQRQVEGHARLAEGDRRPDRVQELLHRRVTGEQDDRRDQPEPVRRLRAGQCRLDGRARLVQLLRRRQVQGRSRRSS